jgi:acetyl-CoA synthetase
MTAETGGGSIHSMLNETRLFPPPAEFAEKAHVGSIGEYQRLWDWAKDDLEGFWAETARAIDWYSDWTKVLDWQPPHAKWFVGATVNAAYNCVDRHCHGTRKNKAAIIWEGEPGERRVLRYDDLRREVSKFANALKGLGVKKGDVVAIYMPMIPELTIAVLACARLGAPHMVVFGGFSSEALAGRIQDCEGAGDGRRWLSSRQGRSAQGECRRRGDELPHDRVGRGLQANRTRHRDDRRA